MVQLCQGGEATWKTSETFRKQSCQRSFKNWPHCSASPLPAHGPKTANKVKETYPESREKNYAFSISTGICEMQ